MRGYRRDMVKVVIIMLYRVEGGGISRYPHDGTTLEVRTQILISVWEEIDANY